MAEQFPDYKPGQQIRARPFNRMVEQARQKAGGHPGGDGGPPRLIVTPGDVIGKSPREWIRVYITAAAASGSGAAAGFCPASYDGYEVVRNGACTYIQPGDAREFAGNLIEINGNTEVPVGTIVRAWPADNQIEWEFDYAGDSLPGSGDYIEVTLVTGVCLVASGSGV